MRRKFLSDFNSPAPRKVPISVRLRVLFGGAINQFGWIFFGFGMIFVWIFAGQADISSIFLFRLETSRTNAIVESVQPTNASENDMLIYEVKYIYFDPFGRQQQGISYTTGDVGMGGRVIVEFLSAYPQISRVEGMRREIFGPGVVFVIIFPLIGLGILTSGIRYGIKANRLLSQGKIAFGKLNSTEFTGASVNERPILKLTFGFRSEDGLDWEVIAKTHEPEDLQDETEEPLLYDPKNPSYAVLLDDLPGSTEFDASGHLVSTSLKETVKILILPFVALLGNGICLLVLLLSSS